MLTGADPSEFEISNENCSEGFLSSEEVCEIEARFDPQSLGPKSAVVTIESEELETSPEATVSGTGAANPGIEVTPASWDAGGTPAGTDTGPTETFTVESTGSTPLEVDNVSLGGIHPGDFEVVDDECSGEAIDPAGECEIEVEFAPGTTGPKAATLDIQSNDSGGTVFVVLEGSGQPNPGAAVTPTSHDFGNVPYKTTSSARAFTLESTGTTPVHVGTAQLTNTSDGFEFADNDCDGVTLDPGEICIVEVALTPQISNTISGSLQFGTDEAGVPTASLTGRGVDNPGLTVTPTSHDYGGRMVGSGPSASQAFTFESTGTTGVLFEVFESVGGPDGGDFTIVNDGCEAYGGFMEPGESCAVEIAFEPASAGAKSGLFGAFSNAGERRSDLTGTGLARGLQVSPTASSTGGVPIGGSGGPLLATLTSTGNVPVTVESVELTGEDASQFRIVGDDCEGEIQPSTSCFVEVFFEPTELGPQQATLSIEADAPGGPWSVLLGGTGVANPGIGLTPASHDFGERIAGTGPSATQAFTIESTGTTDLNLSSIALGGTDPGDFTLSEDCPSALAPDASCQVEVAFEPATAGAKSAHLNVSSDAVGSPSTASLSGTAVAAQRELAISPSSHDFGGLAVGSEGPGQAFVLESTGNVPVTISSLNIAGADEDEFLVYDEDCFAVELEPTQTCEVEVGFEPLSIGAKVAELRIGSNDPDSPATAALSGTGLANPGVEFGPSSLSFGELTAGEGPSAPRTVTIESTGTTPLEIDGVGITGLDHEQFDVTGAGSDCAEAVLAPGETCEVSVVFDPVSAGTFSASAEVSSNGPLVTVALAGTGLEKPEPPPPPAPPSAPAPTPPDCAAPQVGQPSGFVPKIKDAPGVLGVRARFAIAGPTVLEVSATLRYRLDGRTRTAALEERTLSATGRVANYKAALPAGLRANLPPGTPVTLKFTYRARPAADTCTAFGPEKRKSIGTRVARVKLAG